MQYDSKADTLQHIKRVNELLMTVVNELLIRAGKHDNSKLESPEKELFDEYTPKLKYCTYGSMDEVRLALEMNKLVHNECKDVPHDIGLRLLEVVKKHVGEQLNLPPVSNSLPVDFLQNEMIKAIKELAKESTAPDKDTPNWLEADIKQGAEWMYKRLTGNDC